MLCLYDMIALWDLWHEVLDWRCHRHRRIIKSIFPLLIRMPQPLSRLPGGNHDKLMKTRKAKEMEVRKNPIFFCAYLLIQVSNFLLFSSSGNYNVFENFFFFFSNARTPSAK